MVAPKRATVHPSNSGKSTALPKFMRLVDALRILRCEAKRRFSNAASLQPAGLDAVAMAIPYAACDRDRVIPAIHRARGWASTQAIPRTAPRVSTAPSPRPPMLKLGGMTTVPTIVSSRDVSPPREFTIDTGTRAPPCDQLLIRMVGH